ncbi:MAG: PilZ domain-containing protein [Rhodospirillales bacterium]|nr:PilZ domain-containing protein [Rhodospirillales bacterium]
MADFDLGKERRIFSRVDIEKDANGNAGDVLIEGAVADVSVGGIALRTDADLEIGQEIVLEIEDMSPVTGSVSRATDSGFVVALDLSGDAEDKFIAEVMKIQNDLGPDV